MQEMLLDASAILAKWSKHGEATLEFWWCNTTKPEKTRGNKDALHTLCALCSNVKTFRSRSWQLRWCCIARMHTVRCLRFNAEIADSPHSPLRANLVCRRTTMSAMIHSSATAMILCRLGADGGKAYTVHATQHQTINRGHSSRGIALFCWSFIWRDLFAIQPALPHCVIQMFPQWCISIVVVRLRRG